MTTFTQIDVRCALCGALSRQVELSSTSSFGPPDLDLRPAEPARSALAFRVQRCEACGYCWRRIGEALPTAAAVVESAAYRDVLERARMPRLARRLFCAGLVSEAAGEREAAAWRFVEAAWACDDRFAQAPARTCRERAVEMFESALEWGEATAPAGTVKTLVADLLRRAGRFEEAVAVGAEAEALVAGEDDADEPEADAAAVPRFVRALAEAGDDGAHNVAEAFADS